MADTQLPPQLLPCPYCGSSVKAYPIKGTFYSLVGCETSQCPASEISCYPEQWNTRADNHERLKVENAKLREALVETQTTMRLLRGKAFVGQRLMHRGENRELLDRANAADELAAAALNGE